MAEGDDASQSLGVVGIALVVEEVGKGARLVFRYPASPPSIGVVAATTSVPRIEEQTYGSTPPDGGGGGGENAADAAAELFFQLPARAMAKLFRPKPPLCRQPMTLSVGETVFCCRAVLLSEGAGSTPGTQTPSEEGADGSEKDGGQHHSRHSDARGLVMFSVIVALAPRDESCGDGGLSAAAHRGWHASPHSRQQQNHPKHPSLQRHLSASSVGSTMALASDGEGLHDRASASFLAVRRVHVSLARLCRVLEREERRCDYVSIQSAMLIQIRKEEEQSTGSKGRSSVVAAPGGGSSGGEKQSGLPRPARAHRRVASQTGSVVLPSSPKESRVGSNDHASEATDAIMRGGRSGQRGGGGERDRKRREEERNQALIERMLAARPPSPHSNYANAVADETKSTTRTVESSPNDLHQHGNLARELAQTFHALARNDELTFLYPTPRSLLGRHDGTVYINRHIAVPIEAATSGNTNGDYGGALTSGSHLLSSGGTLARHHHPFTSRRNAHEALRKHPAAEAVRPYHTLLFPHASPAELLQSLAIVPPPGTSGSGGSSSSQRLHRLLSMATSRKSLEEISADAALPLFEAIELASYLVDSGACAVAPVVSRWTRFSCNDDAVERMRVLALPFAQRFGSIYPGVPIFLVVSALAGDGSPSMTTLGDAMADAGRGVSPVGRCIASSLQLFDVGGHHRHHIPLAEHRTVASGGGFSEMPSIGSVDGSVAAVEDALYAMAVWLRSHGVIVEVKEYLTAVSAGVVSIPSDNSVLGTSNGAMSVTAYAFENERKTQLRSVESDVSMTGKTEYMVELKAGVESNPSSMTSAEEATYQKLFDAGCLSGNVSCMALCWKLGLDARKLKRFKAWGLKEQKIEVVMRIPAPGDDWGAP